MRTRAVVVLVAVLGCHGRSSFTLGSSSAASPRPATPAEAPELADGRAVGRGDVITGGLPSGKCANPVDSNNAPVATRPHDPWHAVVGDQPAALLLRTDGHNNISAMTEKGPCDAAHDHCFRDCTWLVRDSSEKSPRSFVAAPAHRLPDGRWKTTGGASRYLTSNGYVYEMNPGYVAYRTVPAAKRLLAEGRLVAVSEKVPANGQQALSPWDMGKILRIHWEENTLQIVGSPVHFPLGAVRVVVLEYKDGGKVELASGFAKDEIAVAPNEVFSPPTE